MLPQLLYPIRKSLCLKKSHPLPRDKQPITSATPPAPFSTFRDKRLALVIDQHLTGISVLTFQTRDF